MTWKNHNNKKLTNVIHALIIGTIYLIYHIYSDYNTRVSVSVHFVTCVQ